MIRKEIFDQWLNIADWYYENHETYSEKSIWEILEKDYGISHVHPMPWPGQLFVDFPDEKTYTWFLLRWSS